MTKNEKHQIRIWRWGPPYGFQEYEHPLSGIYDPREAVKEGVISEWSICGMSRPDALEILNQHPKIWWHKWGERFWWREKDSADTLTGRYLAEGEITLHGTQEAGGE